MMKAQIIIFFAFSFKKSGARAFLWSKRVTQSWTQDVFERAVEKRALDIDSDVNALVSSYFNVLAERAGSERPLNVQPY